MKIPVITFQAKVTIFLSGVIIFLGIMAVVQARNDMLRILGNELEKRGEAIARDLAANAGDLILTGDLVGVYDLVNRTTINNEDVRYVLLIDSAGEVRVDTFGGDIPIGLLEANILAPGQPTRLQHFATEEGLIRDVATQVFDGRADTVRVGMSDRSLVSAVSENTRDLIVLVAAAVSASMVLTFWLSYYLTHPLSHLLAAVQNVARGDFTQRIASPSPDEVGRLGTAFNLMAEELEAKEISRKELMGQVISSQEEERRRVARELHDELAQQLTSVLLNLEVLDSKGLDVTPEAGDAIQRMRRVTESALAETRKLIGDLRPTVLDDLGLVPAIRSYAEDHLRPMDTAITVTTTNIPEGLPRAVGTAVYRIVQEAISNVARHAYATQATITLDVRDSILGGRVADNGCGFASGPLEADSVARQAQLGLIGMEERASLLGGTLTVNSHIGRGTVIEFAVPLREVSNV